jgi:lipoprotein NlpD
MLACACAHAKGHAPERSHDIRRGVFHAVHPGETLYRIARAYGTSVEEICKENGVADPARLESSSLLFIPGAERTVEVPPQAAGEEKIEPRSQRRAQPSQIPRAVPGALDPAAGGEPLSWPVHGVLVSGFGMRDREQHEGIDLAAPEGTPIVAASAGTVLFAGEQRGYGRLVLVRHARGLVTIYAHNAVNLVAAGQTVARGQTIARVGRSGRATGPHLHFEVRVETRPRDPLGFVR